MSGVGDYNIYKTADKYHRQRFLPDKSKAAADRVGASS